MRSFLGLCGTVHIWISNYSLLSRPLINLYCKDTPFVWDTPQQDAFNALKIAVSSAPSLHPIDYSSDFPVVLSVDTSYIAIGFILSQYDESGHKHPARYGSLPINERESHYSQPKLELYGLFRALHHYRLFLYGVKNLHVEVDAKYIKGMLNDPDLQPNATINCWIEGILLFDFKLIHVPAAHHQGPDALSRHQPTDEDIEEGERDAEEADEWLEDLLLLSATHPPPDDPIMLPSFLSQDTTQDVLLRQILHFLQMTELPSFPSNSLFAQAIYSNVEALILQPKSSLILTSMCKSSVRPMKILATVECLEYFKLSEIASIGLRCTKTFSTTFIPAMNVKFTVLTKLKFPSLSLPPLKSS